MSRRRILVTAVIAGVALIAISIGVGLFVYGYAVAPLPEAPDLYQRGYTSFVGHQEHSAVCRGVGAAFVTFGLLLAVAPLTLLLRACWYSRDSYSPGSERLAD